MAIARRGFLGSLAATVASPLMVKKTNASSFELVADKPLAQKQEFPPAGTPYSNVPKLNESNDLTLNSANIMFKADGAAFPRPMLHKLRDTVSLLDAMAQGGLDEAIRNREVTSSDADAITPLAQEVVESCSVKLQEAYIPGGLYFLDGPLAVNGPLSLRGDGSSMTALTWTSDAKGSDGIVVVPTGSGASNKQTYIEKIGIYSEKVAIGTAIRVDYTNGLKDRTEPRFTLNDVSCRGTNSWPATNGWQTGLDVVGITMKIDGFNCVTPRVDKALVGCGIRIHGKGDPATIFISNLKISGSRWAIDAADTEGIYIDKSELVGVGTGVRVNNKVQEPSFWFTNSHINAVVSHFELINVKEFGISNNDFYIFENPGRDFNGIIIGHGSNNGRLNGNKYVWKVSSLLCQAIYIDGGTNVSIDGETFDVGDAGRAVGISEQSLNVDIGRNLYISGDRIHNSSPSTTADEWHNFIGDLANIPVQSRRGVQTHFIGDSAQGGPAGISLLNAVCRTYSIDADTGYQELMLMEADTICRRRFVRGDWLPWAFYNPS